MSRRGKHRQAAAAPIPDLRGHSREIAIEQRSAGPVGVIADDAMLDRMPRAAEEAALAPDLDVPAGAPVEDLAPGLEPTAGFCARLVNSDSIRWSCACGASGRVGRSPDGIPYLDAEILRHLPGESKEGV